MLVSYWVESLNIAAYLLNRRPSKAINLLTPFYALYGQPPSYGHLKVFGRLYYPNLSSTTTHNLSPCSTPCVFLEYPAEHNGYRCLELSPCWINYVSSRYILRDQIFLCQDCQTRFIPSVHTCHKKNHVQSSPEPVWAILPPLSVPVAHSKADLIHSAHVLVLPACVFSLGPSLAFSIPPSRSHSPRRINPPVLLCYVAHCLHVRHCNAARSLWLPPSTLFLSHTHTTQ